MKEAFPTTIIRSGGRSSKIVLWRASVTWMVPWVWLEVGVLFWQDVSKIMNKAIKIVVFEILFFTIVSPLQNCGSNYNHFIAKDNRRVYPQCNFRLEVLLCR
jgi:hypothetical protein